MKRIGVLAMSLAALAGAGCGPEDRFAGAADAPAAKAPIAGDSAQVEQLTAQSL